MLANFKVNSNLTSKSPIQSDRDLIGPPDSISNLRPIIFAKSDRETELEKKYRETREATQEWNQRFWTKHNTNFSHERKQFKELLKKEGNNSVSADEMSVFYKQFLDKNWQSHLNYNIAWYKKNLHLLLLEFREWMMGNPVASPQGMAVGATLVKAFRPNF
ncbi:APOPT family protein CG14806, mitochondrial isoform X3 [Cephus cinctus]|uniref:APOPT family protein CG14806, mitochondrial isoform X3 n=1 Tax=Cephus cinctus TaxID=211228 RepID=A0AAJ7RS51_CEPCN|nr:APOPT family protein CG14806, mitochondrial isoform X3 [Cephus cinctus]